MLDALLAEARLRWGLDPAAGLAVVTAERLVATPVEASGPVLLVPAARLRGGSPADGDGVGPKPLPGRHGPGGRDAISVLQRLYPADHPVGRFGDPDGTTVGSLTTDDLARPLYLAPISLVANAASPWGMPWISDRLRAPDGCPWDREQTHESLRNHLLEEAYEVYDALEAGATPELAGELGDLLLQVVLHAQLAAEEGVFDLTDVWQALATKIVRRHPHVFGEAEARTASDVNRQWERIKQGERAEAAARGDGAEAFRSALDGISRSLRVNRQCSSIVCPRPLNGSSLLIGRRVARPVRPARSSAVSQCSSGAARRPRSPRTLAADAASWGATSRSMSLARRYAAPP